MTTRLSFFSWLLAMPFIHAQQFPDFKFLWDTFELSDSCTDAINTSVRCPQMLIAHSETIPTVHFLKKDALVDLCTPVCEHDLTILRGTIEKSCSENDTMVYQRNEYPATYMVDRLLYVYHISCYHDGGNFCDIQMTGKRDHLTSWDLEPDCSNCNLGIWQKQLESPFGYQEDRMSALASLASSCSRSGFEVVAPTLNYGVDIASTALITSTMLYVEKTTDIQVATETFPSEYAQCPIKYTIQENDTCESIAEENGVDTFGILRLNNFNYCPMLPFPGSNICLPLPCKVYKIHDFDTCEGIANRHNTTVANLEKWNSVLGSHCIFMPQIPGWHICVSPPKEPYIMTNHFSLVVATGNDIPTMQPSVVVTGAPLTTDTKTSHSASSLLLSSLTTVSTLTKIRGTQTTTLSTVKATVSTFGVPVNISTQTLPATKDLPSTTPIDTVTSSTATATESTRPVTTVETHPIPTNAMPMSVLDCAKWYTAQAGDTCASVSRVFKIGIVDIKFLNPELEHSCPQMMTGWAYCVAAAGDIASNPGYYPYLSTAFASSSVLSHTPAATTHVISTALTTGSPSTPTSSDLGSKTLSGTSNVELSALVTPTTPIALEPLPFPSDLHGIPTPVLNTTVSVTAANDSPFATNPLAPGTLKGCAEYRDGANMTSVYEALDRSGWDYRLLGDLAANLDSCPFVARAHRTTYPNFLKWNPSLLAHQCLLSVNYSYCARLLPTVDADLNHCDDLSKHPGAVAPKETRENCNCFAVVYGADASYYSCERIQMQFGISNPALLAMNPWIGTGDCTAALYSNLGDVEPRAVCIGAPVPVSPNPDARIATKQPARGTAGDSPINARTRLLARHVLANLPNAQVEVRMNGPKTLLGKATPARVDITAKSNDAATYRDDSKNKDHSVVENVSKDNKNTKNTRLGQSSLHRRRAKTPFAPVHPGTDSDGCIFWHTVMPNEDCRAIANQYAVEDIDFLWWNLGVGKECELLQSGHAVCVGHKDV